MALRTAIKRSLLATRSVAVQQRCSRWNENYSMSQVLAIDVKWRKRLYDLPDTGIISFIDRMRLKSWKERLERYTFSEEEAAALGPEMAAAHFLVRRGIAVKLAGFSGWLEMDGRRVVQLPALKGRGVSVEAIDCSGRDVITEAFERLDLKNLQYLNLSNCRYVDDYTMDKLGRFRDSLVWLDVSGCAKVTERGLSSLYRLRKLRRLCVHDMAHVREAPLLALLLEEHVPGLDVQGMDYTDLDQSVVTERRLPAFLHQFEKTMIKKMKNTKRITFWEARYLKKSSEMEQKILEQEKLEQKILEQEKLEQRTLEREKLEQKILEQERLEQKTLEQEKLEQKTVEQEKLEQKTLEQEKVGQKILEQERLDQKILEQEKVDQKILEQEKLDLRRGAVKV